MITITFQGKDLDEVANQALEFIVALVPSSNEVPPDAVAWLREEPPAAVEQPKAEPPEKDSQAVVEQPKADPEELRAQIRAVLAPVMTSARSAEAKELIAKHGGAVSKIPESDLPAVLEAARKLAS